MLFQSIEETHIEALSSPTLQCYTVSVLNLLVEVATCLREKVGKVPGNYPENLVTEWTEFFSESVFSVVLPLFLRIYSRCLFGFPKAYMSYNADIITNIVLCYINDIARLPKVTY